MYRSSRPLLVGAGSLAIAAACLTGVHTALHRGNADRRTAPDSSRASKRVSRNEVIHGSAVLHLPNGRYVPQDHRESMNATTSSIVGL